MLNLVQLKSKFPRKQLEKELNIFAKIELLKVNARFANECALTFGINCDHFLCDFWF